MTSRSPGMKTAQGDLRVGISGWTYPPWRGAFFPKKWPQHRELEYAACQVNSIEINGTFYSLQRPSSFRAWHDATPQGFVFSVKAPRFITHIKRLRNVAAPLANFFASGLLRLGEKLGPVLWQLPPNFRFDAARLDTFFRLLPRTTGAAARLARRHDSRLKARAWLRTDRDRPLRHACEVRHDSFLDPAFIDLLREHDVALVVADTAGRWPFMEDVTSDFVYVRLHGDEQLYVSGYTPKALREWARKILAWSRGGTPAAAHLLVPQRQAGAKARDVFVYFDNDVKVRAPFDAMSLAHRLGLRSAPPRLSRMPELQETPRTQWAPVRRREG